MIASVSGVAHTQPWPPRAWSAWPWVTSARALGISLPNTATCQELFNAAAAAGGAAWDHSAMVRVLEKLACHEIGAAA